MASSSRTLPGNRWLRLLQSLSCCLGVSPPRRQLRQLHLIWSILLLSWIWIVCVTLLTDKSKMHVLAIEKLLYLIEYPSNMIITALFSLSVYRNGEFFRRQRSQQLRLMKLLYAEAQLCLGILEGIARKLLIMIFSFHGVCIGIDVYWLRLELLQTLISNSAHNLVGLMVSLSFLQYVLDLRVLHLLHLRLNEHLGGIQQQKIFHNICILSHVTLDQVELKLEEFRRIWITMDDMHMKLTQRFGLVFMVNYVNSLLSFCYELFNVFRILEQSNWTDDLIILFYRLLWLLMHGVRIWCTLISNARIAEQKCQLCLVLNKLNAQSPHLESSINRFLLQIQANGINGCPSTVCGVIDLDTLAVGGFVSALTAIVIFLIQRFVSSSSNWSKQKLLILLGVFYRILQLLGNRIHDITAQAGAETNLLVLRLIVDRRLHMFERLLWLAVLLVSIITVFMLSDLQIARYATSPTVISVDRDYRGWNGSLPAVTLCYYDHIDSFKANELIQDLWNVSIIDEDYFYIMDFLYAAVNATASNYAELTKFAADERFEQIDLYDIIQSINRPFGQVISTFDANFEVHVQMVMTERGSCYAINSPMSMMLGKEPVNYEDLPLPLTCQYGKQQCYIRMDLYESTGVLDVHSPYEVSATEANIVTLQKSDEITASFKVLETVASKNLRELSVEQRKCVFNDEETSNLKIYSKSLCLARCRAIMALEMCNCVPFFYPFVEGPSCNPAGFECLLDFKWPIWALHICKCPSTCTEIEYTMQTVKKSSWGIKNAEEASTVESATSSFRWDLIPPKVRFRRDVVFSFEDLIVSFGGVLALFVGVSVTGLVQITYVIIYNVLQDFFKLLRFMLRLFRERFRRATPTSPIHSLNHVSRAETAEIPLFEYVN